MKKITTLSILLVYSFLGNCQNLVSNWSFEDTIPCATNPIPQYLTTAPPWKMAVQTPDFISNYYCGAPFEIWGYQIAKTGTCFAAAAVYDSLAPSPGFKEILGQQLTSSLITGHKYCVTFYVNLANISGFAIDKIGALFTNFEMDPQNYYTFITIPQIENIAGNVITDTLNWTLISGDFIASGGENYLSIGNFHPDGSFQLADVNGLNTNSASFYYFDDISVIDCTVGMEESVYLQFNISPNPIATNGSFKVKSERAIVSYEILAVTGQSIEVNTLTNPSSEIVLKTPGKAGIYFLKLFTKTGSGRTKLIVY